MQQVLFNLVRNAAEAMQGQPQAVVLLQAAAGSGGVEIHVADRGPGVAQAIVPQLFEPFVTTKPRGLGVGLAICRTVVEAHGGSLAYAPRPEGGSIFTIILKPAPATANQAGRAPMPIEARHG
jgi:C4-dicarboxylate-specific signal transduction histidine kinase